MQRVARAARLGAASTVATVARAATYQRDSAHSIVELPYKQTGVNMHGTFANLQGTSSCDQEAPDAMGAVIELPLDTVDTGTDEADAEPIKPEWFDMANHPTATFETSAVSPAGDDDYTVKGVLQIKGETQALEFPVTVQQDDAGRLVFETEFEIDRGDFDVGSGSWSDPSIVSNEVKVKAHIVSK